MYELPIPTKVHLFVARWTLRHGEFLQRGKHYYCCLMAFAFQLTVTNCLCTVARDEKIYGRSCVT